MTESTERKPRSTKAKIFVTELVREDGSTEAIAYTEHYSTTQAQSKALDGRITTRLADHHDLIAIGRRGIDVDYLHAALPDDAQTQLPGT